MTRTKPLDYATATETLRRAIYSKCLRAGDCLLWIAATNSGGYGYTQDPRFPKHHQVRRVHRVLFEIEKGEIPSGMVLDHLCRQRTCCAVGHLEVVTQRENLRRGREARARINSDKPEEKVRRD